MTTLGNGTCPRSHNDLGWSAALNADNLVLSKDGVADVIYDITGRTVNQFCAALATGNYAWSVRGCLVRGVVNIATGTVTLDVTDAGFGPDYSDTETSRTITDVTNPYVFLLEDALVVAQRVSADVNLGDSRVVVSCKAMVTFGAKEIAGDAHVARYAALSWIGDHNGVLTTMSKMPRRYQDYPADGEPMRISLYPGGLRAGGDRVSARS